MVVSYLGRYTHRIAISNNRILSMNLSAGSCFTSRLTALEKSGTMVFLRLGAKKLV